MPPAASPAGTRIGGQYDVSSWRYEGQPIDYASVGGSQGRIVGEAGEGEQGEMEGNGIEEETEELEPGESAELEVDRG